MIGMAKSSTKGGTVLACPTVICEKHDVVCAGEWTFSVYPDAEGDFSEPGGRLVHYFDVAELQEQSCKCTLSSKEMTALEERAIAQAKDRDYD